MSRLIYGWLFILGGDIWLLEGFKTWSRSVKTFKLILFLFGWLDKGDIYYVAIATFGEVAVT